MNSNSNSYPSQSQSPYPQHQQQSSNSINPALLAAFQNGGGQTGNKFPYGGGGGGGVNPAQLMNGMGMMGGGSTNTQMSPAQLLQQQQGLGSGMGMGNMMTGGGMGMGGMGGINPSMLTQQTHSMSNSHPNNFNPGMGMGNGIDINTMNMGGMAGMSMAGMGNVNIGGMGNASSSMGLTSPSSMGPNLNQNNFTMNAVMNAMGLSKEQLQQMTPPERQMAGEKVYLAMQQHKNQQQQQQQMSMDGHGALQGGSFHANLQPDMQGLLARNSGGGNGGTSGFYERPSSSASSHHHSHSNNSNTNNANPGSNSNHMQQQMMPPPPPRPTTAMAHSSSISRPGTSHSHHSPSGSSNSGLGQRPPSRAGEYSHGHHGHQQQQHFNGIPNGYSTGKSQGQQMHQSSYPSTPQVQNQNPYPQSQQGQGQGHGQQHQSPPPPGSPYRGAKRKVADGNGVVDSPRVSSGMGLPSGGMMGPPVLPRQLSGSGEHFMQHSSQSQSQAQHMGMGGNHTLQAPNGYPSVPQRHATHSPVNMRPPSSNGLPSHMHAATASLPNHQVNNAQIGLGMIGDEPSVRINPATASAGAMGMNMSTSGMMNGMSMNMSGNGSMSMGMTMDSASRTPQRQMSNPPQASLYPGLGVVPPQPHRQPSIPPVTPMKPVVDMGMNMGVGLGITGGGLKLGAIPPGAAPPRIPSVAPNPSTTASPAQQQTAAANSAVIPQLPSLPANVNLNPAVTRVTVVPLVDSLKTIPALSDSEIEDVQGWMKIDKEYEATYRKMKERMAEEAREVFGPGTIAWWEKGALDINPNRWRRGREQFDVRYPKNRKERDGRERRKTGRREGLKL